MKQLFTPLLIASALLSSAFAQGLSEDFEKAEDGASLAASGLAGWRQEGSASDQGARILGEAAFSSGRGLELSERETFAIYESEKPFWTKMDGPLTFYMTFRLNGKMPIDIALHNGTTSFGFYISINSRTGELALSQGGGESIYRGETAVHPIKELEDGVWYTLEIRDVDLTAAPAMGKVYIYEAPSPSNLLVDGLTILASGNTAPSGLRAFAVRRWGSNNEVLTIDNVRVEAAASW